MTRLMRDAAFKQNQHLTKYDSHIQPINQLVDSLSSPPDRWMPYVAPLYGGIHARLLSILRDPGPKTQEAVGSGFICMENDDATAERLCKQFETHSIPGRDAMLWNIYPWYINQQPTKAQIKLGIDVLVKLIALLPKLKVVMLHGVDAKAGWKMLTQHYPDFKKYHVIETYHPSRQAFWHADPIVRQSRLEHFNQAFLECANVLNALKRKN